MIEGAVIVGQTMGGSMSVDHEPNGTLGTASLVGALGPSRVAALRGETQAKLWLHGLVPSAAGATLVSRNLFGVDGDRFRVVSREDFVPRLATDSADGLFLLDDRLDLWVRQRSAPSGKEPLEWRLPHAGEVRGFSALLDHLLFLKHDTSTGVTTLVGRNPEDGIVGFEVSLGVANYQGLTGARDFRTGQPRLFTWNATENSLVEFDITHTGSEWTIRAPIRSADLGTTVGSSALSFDGLLLHVPQNDSIHSVDPDTLELVSELPPLADGLLALATRFDAGLDGYRACLEPRANVDVRLWAASGQSTTFLAAIDRQKALDGDPDAVLFLDFASEDGTTAPRSLEAWESARGIDFVVGTLGEGSGYQVLAGVSRGAENLTPMNNVPSSSAPGAILRYLRRQVADGFTAQGLAALYLDFELGDYVPGQLVYQPRDEVRSAASPTRQAGFALRETERSPAGHRTLKIESASPGISRELLRVNNSTSSRTNRQERDRQLMTLLNSLDESGEVEWCEPLYRAQILRVPNDTFYSLQAWHHNSLNLSSAWDVSTGSESVVIAVVDSGIKTENIDLAATLQDGYDFISDIGNAADGNGMDSDPYDEASESMSPSHGTHVAGSAGAIGNNAVGVVGAMWTCRIMPVRAIGITGSGTVSDIAAGIRYAAGLANVSGTLPGTRADIINLSLGTPSVSATLQSAVNAATSAGVACLAATGNDALDDPTPNVLYPAAFSGVISVGASNSLGSRSGFSNYGPGFEVDFLAPGGDADPFGEAILSTTGGGATGGYGYLVGTSMATGLASGVAGLVLGVQPNLSPAELRNLLRDTARPGPAGQEAFYGAGFLDANAAINAAAPMISVSATSLDFGQNGSNLAFQAINLGGGSLVVESITIDGEMGGDASWLDYELADDSSVKTIVLRADRTGLSDGVYEATVTVASNGGEPQEVQVLLTESSAPLPDVGQVTIELRDANGNLVRTDTTTVDDDYSYQLSQFQRSSFGLMCGVDLDDDGSICEPGERCGTYPNVAEAEDGNLNLETIRNLNLDILLEN